MKNEIYFIILLLFLYFALSVCANWDGFLKDMKSDINGGLNQIVTVYSDTGSPIVVYEGKINIESLKGNRIMFDLDGKRIVLYNCSVIVEER